MEGSRVDAAFDAMADAERRALLLELRRDGRQRVPELSGPSREVANATGAFRDEYLSGSLEIPGADERLVRLHEVHLPKLARYGFVEWDPGAPVVSTGPRFEELDPLLEVVADEQAPKVETVRPRRP